VFGANLCGTFPFVWCLRVRGVLPESAGA